MCGRERHRENEKWWCGGWGGVGTVYFLEASKIWKWRQRMLALGALVISEVSLLLIP